MNSVIILKKIRLCQSGKLNMVTSQIWHKSCLTNSSLQAIQNGGNNQEWSSCFHMHMKGKVRSTPVHALKDIYNFAQKTTGPLRTFRVQLTISTYCVDRQKCLELMWNVR